MLWNVRFESKKNISLLGSFLWNDSLKQQNLCKAGPSWSCKEYTKLINVSNILLWCSRSSNPSLTPVFRNWIAQMVNVTLDWNLPFLSFVYHFRQLWTDARWPPVHGLPSWSTYMDYPKMNYATEVYWYWGRLGHPFFFSFSVKSVSWYWVGRSDWKKNTKGKITRILAEFGLVGRR